MIYLIVGENAHVVKRELAHITQETGVEPEYVDGAMLDIGQLADIIRAQVLFAAQRLIICRGISENKYVWDKLGEWINEVGDETTLVVVEAKPDKRTKAYKAIAKHAQTVTADQLTDRDWRQAERWLSEYAQTRSVKLSQAQLSDMVQRALLPTEKPGRQCIDQQVLATAVDSLASLTQVDDAAIAAVMPRSSQGTVFDLLRYALEHDLVKTWSLIAQLRREDEALAVFPSLMSQWAQLVEVALLGERGAIELGIHPYVVQKLMPLVHRVGRDRLKTLTDLGARLDADMKRSAIEPWDAIDRFTLALMTG
jgi:DNA polymerase III delta subunit